MMSHPSGLAHNIYCQLLNKVKDWNGIGQPTFQSLGPMTTLQGTITADAEKSEAILQD